MRTSPEPEQLDGRCILVIDDSDSVRMVLAAMLRACGAEVSTASSGRVGLDMLRTDDFDLVLVDWSMPEMGGAEVVRRIKVCKPDVPTIVCSGNAGDCSGLAADEKPDSVLQKPLGLHQISTEINNLLGNTDAA